MKWIMVVVVAALSGCAGLGGISSIDASHMTEAQINALVKDKSAAAVCTMIVTPSGTMRMVAVNLDQGTFRAQGSIQIKADTCDTSIVTAPLAPVPK